jgi:hypothetical protein
MSSLVCVVLACSSVGRADDGRPIGGIRRPGCPDSSYSRLNFLTPNGVRFIAYRDRVGSYTYPVDQYPELPLNKPELRYRCPALAPENYPFPPYNLNAQKPEQ